MISIQKPDSGVNNGRKIWNNVHPIKTSHWVVLALVRPAQIKKSTKPLNYRNVQTKSEHWNHFSVSLFFYNFNQNNFILRELQSWMARVVNIPATVRVYWPVFLIFTVKVYFVVLFKIGIKAQQRRKWGHKSVVLKFLTTFARFLLTRVFKNIKECVVWTSCIFFYYFVK